MPAINFTAQEIKKSLENKTKTQTIRPAYYESASVRKDSNIWNEKPAHVEVGQEVKIYWNQRSKSNRMLGFVTITEVFQIEMSNELINFGDSRVHWKVIDTTAQFLSDELKLINQGYQLYTRDGFETAEAMRKWFDDHYDLSVPKKFWVYRFCWRK